MTGQRSVGRSTFGVVRRSVPSSNIISIAISISIIIISSSSSIIIITTIIIIITIVISII